jgi:drug/metabolite transporter superfamily protein YnfA
MLQPVSAITAGAVLLAVVTIAYGGTFMLRVVTGKQNANDLQKSFFRAGHAHAGVLVILGLVVLLLLDSAHVTGWMHVGADGVLASAILIPAGFFLSVLGRDPRKPNGVFALVWTGFVVLAASLVIAGIALIVTGANGL